MVVLENVSGDRLEACPTIALATGRQPAKNEAMKKPALFLRVVALGIAALLTGCKTCKEDTLTGKLWYSHQFTHFREPMPDPHLAVFYAPAFNDFLVAFDSMRDDEDSPRRLTYFIQANERHIADHEQPDFVSTNGLNLVFVPLNAATNILPYATYDALLTIRTSEERLGPYPLPNYKESDGLAVKTALTPLAVTGDATVVGLVLGAVFVVGLCQSGFSFAVH
jgi:hypothetical protein